MFTGIVQGTAPVELVKSKDGILLYALNFDSTLLKNLVPGASVSVDGCCQTLVKTEGSLVYFQAIGETLKRTSLGSYTVGQKVNIERAAHFGDEIGGHLLSGHIYGTARLKKIEKPAAKQWIFHLECPKEWMAYILEKGFVALDGASLTVVDVFPEGIFTVHLIPETLARTTFASKKEGSLFNVEIDSMTQTIVATVERILATRKP